MENGKKNGAFRKYNPYGTIDTYGRYKNDTLNGEFITYGKNGKVDRIGSYKMGVPEGIFIFFGQNGDTSQMDMNNSGKMDWEIKYKDNKRVLKLDFVKKTCIRYSGSNTTIDTLQDLEQPRW